jgi:hypothetical protein
MNAEFSESKNAATGARWPKTPVIVLAATMSALAIYAIVSAPGMWRSAERFRAELSRQEDRTYCEKFRMPPGSESFAICAAIWQNPAALKQTARSCRNILIKTCAGAPEHPLMI